MAHMRARITLADFAMFVPALAHFNEAETCACRWTEKDIKPSVQTLYIKQYSKSFAESRSYDKPLERKK